MPSCSMAAMFGIVPYLVSPVIWRGRKFQRKRAHQSRSRAGWFSCTSAGATKAARMIRARPPCPTPVNDIVVLIAQVGAPISPRHRRGVRIGGADAEVGRPPVGPARYGPVRATRVPDPVMAGRGTLGQFSLCLVRQRDRQPRRFVASTFPD